MKVFLDNMAFAPERAHSTDAGYDLRAKDAGIVFEHWHKVFDTGVHIQLPPGTCGILVSKSGLNVNHHITSTGLIDEGYTGSIKVKLYNHGDTPFVVNEGDKISQLIIVPVKYEPVELVDDIAALGESERGSNGFGSTGR